MILLDPVQVVELTGIMKRRRSDILRLNERFEQLDVSIKDYRLGILACSKDYERAEQELNQGGYSSAVSKAKAGFLKKDK